MFVKGKGSCWKPQEIAIEAPWTQLHCNDRHWVMADLDECDWQAHKRFPVEPNIVSYNAESGHSQQFWRLSDPVYCHGDQRQHKAHRYLRAIESAIDAQYGTDHHFARAISKNPLHKLWDNDFRHSRGHTLPELHEGLLLDLTTVGYGGKGKPKGKSKATVEGQYGRNAQTFDQVRFWAYEHAPMFKQAGLEYEDWYRAVRMQVNTVNARFINTADGVMDAVECNYIARSIASYCWRVQVSLRRKPKLTMEQIRQKQVQSAQMTTAKKVGASEAAIKLAITQLQADGKKPTKAAVARLVNLSRQQVSTRYNYLF